MSINKKKKFSRSTTIKCWGKKFLYLGIYVDMYVCIENYKKTKKLKKIYVYIKINK